MQLYGIPTDKGPTQDPPHSVATHRRSRSGGGIKLACSTVGIYRVTQRYQVECSAVGRHGVTYTNTQYRKCRTCNNASYLIIVTCGGHRPIQVKLNLFRLRRRVWHLYITVRYLELDVCAVHDDNNETTNSIRRTM